MMSSARFVVSAYLVFALTLAFATPQRMRAQDNSVLSTMAPIDQYLMDRDAEMALARSAGPNSISSGARVLVLGRRGYETAVEGKNDFVCLVERSWNLPSDDPAFWNPKIRGPICLNAAAARSYLQTTIKKTELAIAGRSNTQIKDAITAAIAKGELPTPEPGAMAYMMAKQGYLNGVIKGPWLPHVMFYVPEINPQSLGSDQDDVPLDGHEDTVGRFTVIDVPVSKWSDGTPSPLNGGGH
jgi:hypothetical protein